MTWSNKSSGSHEGGAGIVGGGALAAAAAPIIDGANGE
jgi:hypothetical protein